jgi:hypothetical protein
MACRPGSYAAAAAVMLCLALAIDAEGSGSWVTQGNLSNPQAEVATFPTIALDARGGATAGWVDTSGAVSNLLASVRPIAGAWGTPNQLSGLLVNFDQVRAGPSDSRRRARRRRRRVGGGP